MEKVEVEEMVREQEQEQEQEQPEQVGGGGGWVGGGGGGGGGGAKNKLLFTARSKEQTTGRRSPASATGIRYSCVRFSTSVARPRPLVQML